MTAPRFRSWAVTHPGTKRTHNEDAYVDRPDLGLWAVADGAGGHAAGEVASGMIADALEAIPAGLSASELLAQVRLAIERTHLALREEAARRGPDVMVASTVVVMLARGDHFACLWAGDSRAYLLRGGMLRQITRDHSLVQELLEAGAIGPDEVDEPSAGNVITRAVGCGTRRVRARQGQRPAGARRSVPAVQRRSVQDVAGERTGQPARCDQRRRRRRR